MPPTLNKILIHEVDIQAYSRFRKESGFENPPEPYKTGYLALLLPCVGERTNSK